MFQQEPATSMETFLPGDREHVAAIDTRGRMGDGGPHAPSPDRAAVDRPRKEPPWPR